MDDLESSLVEVPTVCALSRIAWCWPNETCLAEQLDVVFLVLHILAAVIVSVILAHDAPVRARHKVPTPRFHGLRYNMENSWDPSVANGVKTSRH